jgi:hypothetical protein
MTMNSLFHPMRRSDPSAWNTLYTMYAIAHFCSILDKEYEAYNVINHQIWNPIEAAVSDILGVDNMDILLRGAMREFNGETKTF